MNRTDNVLGCLPLVEKIIERMKAAPLSAIKFRDYMDMCLYDQEHGYYMLEKLKIGKEGDFYTSSHIGTVLGDTLAHFIGRLASEERGAYTVTEWGAGTGRLASQILDRLKKDAEEIYNALNYRIIDRSGYHRTQQLEQLKNHGERVVFLEPQEWERLDTEPRGLTLSNELLDAFPVHRVRQREEGLMEIYVRWNSLETRFEELELPCGDPRLPEYLDAEGIRLASGQTAEINLEAGLFIKRQAERMPAGGTIVTIDYGDVADEIYSTHRMSGTLMCYKGHQAYDQPYIYIGEQDITSHVDFSGCIRAGLGAGLNRWRYMTQKEFLLENGILDMLREHNGSDPFSPEAKRNRAIRQILLTDQMSELFKVLIQTKQPG